MKPPLAIVAAEAPVRSKRSIYPEPFATRMEGRLKHPFGDLFGLGNFGVNLTRLLPGAVSSLRHAHSKQDEFIYTLEGCPTLHTDEGHTLLRPGMCAGFKAGGHSLSMAPGSSRTRTVRRTEPSSTPLVIRTDSRSQSAQVGPSRSWCPKGVGSESSSASIVRSRHRPQETKLDIHPRHALVRRRLRCCPGASYRAGRLSPYADKHSVPRRGRSGSSAPNAGAWELH